MLSKIMRARQILLRNLRQNRVVYADVMRRMRPHLHRMAIATGGLLAASIIEVLRPWPLKVVIDNVLRGVPIPYAFARGIDRGELLAIACIALIAIYAMLGVLNVVNGYLNQSIGQRMVNDLRTELFDHLQRLSLSFHRRREIGDLMVRLTSDTYSIQMIVMAGIFPALSSVVFLAGIFVVMLRLDAELALTAISVVPFLFILIALLTRKIHRISDAQFVKDSRLYTVAQNALSATHVLQAFTGERESGRAFATASRESLAASLRLQLAEAIYSGAVNLMVAAGTATVVYLGARHVMQARLTLGDLVVFAAYLASLYGPVNQVFQTYGQVRAAQAGLGRCLELMALDPEIKDLPEAHAIARVRGEIEFDHVYFGYDAGEPLLKGVSFKVHAGERIAIVGLTGAGKTTITQLLARFFDPDRGTIRIDGTDIRNVRVKSLRRNIAMVMQPPLVLGATLRANIALGKPGATEAEILRAAESAQLLSLLASVPHGLDALIGPGGHTLSEGETQRVTIARALLKDAPILIMDEPTSALDLETEVEVLDAVEEAMRGRTTIVIAHRLSTIHGADRILVLRDGVIEESGTFEQLRARGGLFSHLYEIQAWGEEKPLRRHRA